MGQKKCMRKRIPNRIPTRRRRRQELCLGSFRSSLYIRIHYVYMDLAMVPTWHSHSPECTSCWLLVLSVREMMFFFRHSAWCRDQIIESKQSIHRRRPIRLAPHSFECIRCNIVRCMPQNVMQQIERVQRTCIRQQSMFLSLRCCCCSFAKCAALWDAARYVSRANVCYSNVSTIRIK